MTAIRRRGVDVVVRLERPTHALGRRRHRLRGQAAHRSGAARRRRRAPARRRRRSRPADASSHGRALERDRPRRRRRVHSHRAGARTRSTRPRCRAARSGTRPRSATRSARAPSSDSRGRTRGRRSYARPPRPRSRDARVQAHGDAGQLRGGIGVGQAAADGAAIADGACDRPRAAPRASKGTLVAIESRSAPPSAAASWPRSRTPPARSTMYDERGTRFTSTSRAGAASRMFRIGIRLCPPARIRASSPWAASSASTSSVEAAAT